MASFKEMQKNGVIKRADKSLVQYQDIHVRPGFNLRDEGDADFEADLQALEAHIAAGGKVPALEVIPRDEGGVELVDGHRRHIVYGRLIAKGHPIDWIEITQFVGNDMQRTARILTSQEGRKLKPLEIAAGYQRLAAFGLSAEEIARYVHKTRQHVDQMLILANAPHEVHKAVKGGEISATDASKMARGGEAKAKEKLAEGRAAAKAAGATKITGKLLKPWTPKHEHFAPVLDSAKEIIAALPKDARARLASTAVALGENETVAVNARWVRQMLEDMATIEQAKRDAEEKVRAKAAKAGQKEIEAAQGE